MLSLHYLEVDDLYLLRGRGTGRGSKKIGLKEDVAKSLILQTMIGSAEMLKASEKHPSILRKEITSPGGTTEAGIEVLKEHNFQQALISCITQATKRSHDLGKTLEEIAKEK